jgi:hypothetical protein
MDNMNAEAVLARRVKREQAIKGAKAPVKKGQKKTAPHKQTHYVGNEDVHTDNSSARQTDVVADIDRDSELPQSWKRPSVLDAPAPRPGFVQRWVRYRTGNQEDADNVEKSMSQGWRPVKKAARRREHELTADLHGKYGQFIVKRGLILMELPEHLAQQRNETYAEDQRRMTESIDRNFFKVNNRVMPLMKPSRKTTVSKVARRGRLDLADIPDGDDE